MINTKSTGLSHLVLPFVVPNNSTRPLSMAFRERDIYPGKNYTRDGILKEKESPAM